MPFTRSPAPAGRLPCAGRLGRRILLPPAAGAPPARSPRVARSVAALLLLPLLDACCTCPRPCRSRGTCRRPPCGCPSAVGVEVLLAAPLVVELRVAETFVVRRGRPAMYDMPPPATIAARSSPPVSGLRHFGHSFLPYLSYHPGRTTARLLVQEITLASAAASWATAYSACTTSVNSLRSTSPSPERSNASKSLTICSCRRRRPGRRS